MEHNFMVYRKDMRILFLLMTFAIIPSFIFAQDTDGIFLPKLKQLEFSLRKTEVSNLDGRTYWRTEGNKSCLYSDHFYTIDIPVDPEKLHEVKFEVNNYDIDYRDPQGCPGGAEIDVLYLNDNRLPGSLSGANNSWSNNQRDLDTSIFINGENKIYIDTDSTNTGCWCVGVGEIVVSAIVDFGVVETSPTDKEKNRQFIVDRSDITVTFSDDYDPDTLTSDSFKLQYRDASGNYKDVAGVFSQVSSDEFKFTPNTNLKDAIKYYVTIVSGESGIKSTTGSPLPSDIEYTFETVPDLSLEDNFDYGDGETCAPSKAPCKGLELAIFQTSRNPPLVSHKPFVRRIYTRWKKHNDVYEDDQVKELSYQVSKLNSYSQGAGVNTVKRRDQYSKKEIALGEHTVNSIAQSSDTSFELEIKPYPQKNKEEVTYSTSLSLSKSPSVDNYSFEFLDYQGVGMSVTTLQPGGYDAVSNNVIKNQLPWVTEFFPVSKVTPYKTGRVAEVYFYPYTETSLEDKGVCKDPNDFSIIRSADDEMSCMLWFSRYYNGELKNTGEKRTYGVLVTPAYTNGVVGTTLAYAGRRLDGKRTDGIVIQEGGKGSDVVFPHEMYHSFGISHVSGRPNKDSIIEGFRFSPFENYSNFEGSKQNAGGVKPIYDLMYANDLKGIIPGTNVWVDYRDYNKIAEKSGAILKSTTLKNLNPKKINTNPVYLWVRGEADISNNFIVINHTKQRNWNNSEVVEPSNYSCDIQLLDVNKKVLSEGVFAIEAIAFPDDPNPSTGGSVFGGVLWDDAGETVRMTCENLTTEFSVIDNKPVVEIISPAENTVISGDIELMWNTIDVDGDTLYQNPYLGDFLQPGAKGNNFVFDST
ncbi:Ig-like domain-containing protein, partial [Ostreibacterium oceani]